MFGALPPRLYADLVGKPYAANGRGPAAFDCLGLTIELLRRNGLNVPTYASTEEELRAQHSDGLLGPCYRIDSPDAGAVVLMRSVGGVAERHLGVMIDRYRMIHASEPAGSVVIQTLTQSVWGRRVLGFYFPEPRP